MPVVVEMLGKKFGRLKVIGKEPRGSYGGARWRCECECGNEITTLGGNLRRGATKSCGCLHKETARAFASGRALPLQGKRFGRLIVLHRAHKDRRGAHWKCRCDCGIEVVVHAGDLTRKRSPTRSCGCISSPSLVGRRFGKLLVVEKADGRATKRGGTVWLCRCDCGRELSVRAGALGASKEPQRSCGCESALGASRRFTKHGRYNTPTYRIWLGMRNRCSRSTQHNFADYGGRGITVCERWNDFANFLADMGERPEGKSLDRIDPNGHYEPGNCRWATPKEQCATKRLSHERVAAILADMRAASTDLLERAVLDRVRIALLGK